jgi:hypothetical protein
MTEDHDPTTADAYAALRQQVDQHTDVDRGLADLHVRVGRRRRWATTGIAAALVALVAGGALALVTVGPDATDPAGTTPSTTAPVTSVPAEDRCGPPTTSVYLELVATPEQIQGIRDELDAMGLEPYEFVDREATYQEFQQLFADSPDFVGSIRPEELPERFQITAEVSADEFAVLETLPGVLRVEAAPNCPPEDGLSDVVEDRCGTATAFVYMEPLATPEQVQVVRDELEALALEPYEFVDREATYQEFQQLFADQPDFVDSITPEQLPERFQITAEVSAEDVAVLETLPGVLRVEGCPATDGPSNDSATTTSMDDGG